MRHYFVQVACICTIENFSDQVMVSSDSVVEACEPYTHFHEKSRLMTILCQHCQCMTHIIIFIHIQAQIVQHLIQTEIEEMTLCPDVLHTRKYGIYYLGARLTTYKFGYVPLRNVNTKRFRVRIEEDVGIRTDSTCHVSCWHPFVYRNIELGGVKIEKLLISFSDKLIKIAITLRNTTVECLCTANDFHGPSTGSDKRHIGVGL